jgi:(R,R)-butanediol dehydrogenase/meso-butanediol dehydrogenase/diacetyl reductase
VRAAVFRGVGQPLSVEQAPEPLPEDGDLVLAVAACGICGSDLHASAVPDYGLRPGTVLGHEFAGTVLRSAAPGWAVGDRAAVIPFALCAACEPLGDCRDGLMPVCPALRGLGFSPAAPGGYAQQVRVRASQALRLPDAVSLADGALLEPLAVAAHAVALGRIGPGLRVLVIGAGPIGLGVAALARLAGADHVVVSEPAAGRRARALAVGATAVVDPAEADAAPAFRAADIIIECVGIPGMIGHCIELARPQGRILVVGVCMEEDRIRPRLAIRKEIALQFAFAYTRADFALVLDHLAAGRLRAADFVTAVIGLDARPETFEALRHPTDQVKVLVDPSL